MKTYSYILPLLGVSLVLSGCSMQDRSLDPGEIIPKMTTEEKARFVIGTGFTEGVEGNNPTIGSTQKLVPGAAGTTYPLDSLGIPAIVLADGPAGLRIDATRPNDRNTYYCTHFPIGTLLACTWNQSLVEEVGRAIGNEVKEYGVDVLLAPAVNIQRNPLCGRNFEYYSEDPLLAGKTAAAYIEGVQSNGVGTSLKHFAVNNQETNRMDNDARLSQRALREIYLKPFEIAVTEAHPWTVMSSYNHVNGQYASESKELLTHVLRDDWGYQGTVMTDWYGGRDGVRQVWAGNDMLQPGRKAQYTQILDGIKSGKLAGKDLDRNVGRILNLIEKTPRFKGYKYTNKPDLKAHAAITRQSATEGMVLLKNDAATLPLDKNVRRVALYGCTSYDFIAGGTGSGNVNHAYVVNLLKGFENAHFKVDGSLRDFYTQAITVHKQKLEKENAEKAKKDPKFAFVSKFLPSQLPVEPALGREALARQVVDNDVAIITIGRISGEFLDRTDADFNLSKEETQMIKDVCQAYHAQGKKVIVLLNIGGVIETASWKDLPDAILCAWQAGQEGGNSVVDLLSGRESPSGRLSMTFPVAYEDVYSSRNFPTGGTVKFDINNTEKTNKVLERNVDFTNYEEDIYVGYRYFDSFGKAVSYPFGFGLSYTTFALGKPSVEESDENYVVSVEVKNVGKTPGKEVVELYVAAPRSRELNKPAKELKGFAKTRNLKPGESEILTITVPSMSLASFDEAASEWKVDAGKYEFLLGRSSKDILQRATVDVRAQTKKVSNVLKPQSKLNLLSRIQ